MNNQTNELRSYIIDSISDVSADKAQQLTHDWGDLRQGLHQWLFNEDYYIIGYYNATKWLGSDAFEAIGMIQEYEQDNFGQVTTDLSCPERVANMSAYIIGEALIYSDNKVESAIQIALMRHLMEHIA
jgi:hypothetical protein|tara:strand:- start:5249 stop:5632 length:384 start_codon:yes stop_codon:yes gene_type:complete